MTEATLARLRPLVAQAYWAARTPREEGLVALLMAFCGMCDPYWDRPIRGSARESAA